MSAPLADALYYMRLTHKPKDTSMPKPATQVAISMSRAEAYFLAQVLYEIGGDPEGPRRHLDSILQKLLSLGIAPTGKESVLNISVMD